MTVNLKEQAFRGTFWSVIERFSLQGVQFIIGVIMARLLSPHDYGVIGMIAVFMSISQVFIDGGFTSALIQKKELSDEDFSTVFYINMGASFLCYGILFVIAPYISSFYNQPILTSLTRIYGLNLIINSLVAVNKTKLVIALDFKTQSKISFISATISGGIGILSAYWGLSVWALVVQILSNSFFNLCLSFYFVRWFPHQTFSYKSFRNLFSFGSKLLVASLISSVYSNLYSIVIGKKFTSDKLGYYTRANQFAQLVSVNIASVLSRVSFPLLSQIQDDDSRLVHVYSKYIRMSAFLVFPIVLGIGGIAKPLIQFLLSDTWIDAAYLLQILVFAYLWDCIVDVNLSLLKVKGRTDLLLRLEIIKKSIAASILCVTLFFNLTIICWGMVVYSCVSFYLNTLYTKKILNYSFKQQFVEILPYLLCALVVYCQGYFICELVSSPCLSIVISFVVCSISYLFLCYLFNSEPMRLLYIVLKNKLNFL